LKPGGSATPDITDDMRAWVLLLHLVHGVVDGGRDQVLEHLAILGDDLGLDLHTLYFVFAIHRDFDHATADSPVTSIVAISSWAFFMLACSAIACFIMFPPPRIEVSSIWSVAFLFRGPHRLRVQRCAKTVLHFAHRRVFLERAPRRIERLGRAPFTVLSRRFRSAARRRQTRV
jgi:hypothetical protein